MMPVELSCPQEHDGQELLVALLFHTFTDTQWKWSTMEQESYGIYYAVIKWNYYLQGSNIVVCNDHKPLQKFLNGKNTKNKVNRWSLEFATYNIKFEWISGACNMTALPLMIGRCQGHPCNPYSFNKYVSYIYSRWSCHPHLQQNM